MPSDWQRQKVYRAESRAARLTRTRSRSEHEEVYGLHVGIRDAQSVADELYRLYGVAGFDLKAPNVTRTHRSPGSGVATRSTGSIRLGIPTSLAVVVHEVTHLTVPRMRPGHGIEFARNLALGLELLGWDESARDLRTAYEQSKVAYDFTRREAYTRKRARWAVGAANSEHSLVGVLLRDDVPLPDGLDSLEPISCRISAAEATPEGLVLRTAAGSSSSRPGEWPLIPYEKIAYVDVW